MRVLVAIALIGCATTRAARPEPVAKPPVQVTVTAISCLGQREVIDSVTRAFVEHHADRSGLACSVVETSEGNVSLRVTRANGDVGLERSYTLGPTDCTSAAQLLALTVDRWLTSFPEWVEAPVAPPAAARAIETIEITAVTALSSIWSPIGVDGELGAIVDTGARSERFGGSLVVRASVPQRAGSGHFQQTAFLTGASWRHRMGAWTTRLELRGGAVLVSGMGFAENASDWLPWWEGAAFAGRDFGWTTLGIELAATALRDHAVTRDGLVSEDVPFVRIGLGGMFKIR